MAWESSGGPLTAGPAGGREPPEAAGTPPDRMATVEMAADEYAQAGAATPAPLLVDLQHHAIEHDGVIAGDGARFLVAEDLVQVMPAHRHEGAAGISRGAAEAGVVVGNEALAQIVVGGSEGPDLGDPQLVDETPLQGAVGALAAPAGLGREAHDVLDAEPGQGPADLGELRAVGVRARRRRVDGPAGAVGVERPRDAVLLEHRPQRRHDGRQTLAPRDELGVEQVLGRVV